MSTTVKLNVKGTLEKGKWYNDEWEPSTEDFDFEYFVEFNKLELDKVLKKYIKGNVVYHLGFPEAIWEIALRHDIHENGIKVSNERIIEKMKQPFAEANHYIFASCLLSEIIKYYKTELK